VTRGGDAYISVLEKMTNRDAVREDLGSLVWSAEKLSPAARVRTAELLVACVEHADGDDMGFQLSSTTGDLLELMPQLERPTQDRVSTEAMTILLDYQASSDRIYRSRWGTPIEDSLSDLEFGPFPSGVMAMTNARSLASLLEHPAATDGPRECMLQRLEELVFYDGQHYFLTLPDYESESSGLLQPKPERPPRRFHDVYDAAEWIQKNWPDFDLEAAYPVTWRGER